MNKQQAINLLKNLEQSLDDYCELNDEGKTAFRMGITALELFGNAEQLPSAQQEIIRCKECKFANSLKIGVVCRNMSHSVTENDFCSRAERRTNG